MTRRITRTTYRDVRQTRAAPKPEWALVDRTGHEQDTGHSSSYRWNQCLRVGAGLEGSGEVDERKAWRCPDCGAPIDLGEGENVPECCPRCGSVEPADWR